MFFESILRTVLQEGSDRSTAQLEKVVKARYQHGTHGANRILPWAGAAF